MSVAKDTITTTDDLYERDGFAWAAREAALLRERRFGEIDLANIIAEIETVGRSERRSIVSSYRLMLMPLLKWEYQAERRSKPWTDTISRERGTLELDEDRNPSLAKNPGPQIAEAYRIARRDAARETNLSLPTFPAECPYTADQLRNSDFQPE